MTTYTVRDDTDQPLEYFTDLAAAVTAVDAACEAHTFDLNTVPGSRLHPMVTADLDASDVGDVVYGKIQCAGDPAHDWITLLD